MLGLKLDRLSKTGPSVSISWHACDTDLSYICPLNDKAHAECIEIIS